MHWSGISPLFSSDPEQLKKELNELVSAIEEHFFQPQKYNLQPKAEWNISALDIIRIRSAVFLRTKWLKQLLQVFIYF